MCFDEGCSSWIALCAPILGFGNPGTERPDLFSKAQQAVCLTGPNHCTALSRLTERRGLGRKTQWPRFGEADLPKDCHAGLGTSPLVAVQELPVVTQTS